MLLPWRDLAPGNGPVINTSLTVRETKELQRIVRSVEYSPASMPEVLEVGSAFGYSTVALALAGARVTAVDPHVQLASYEQMLANLGAYGVAHLVDIRRGDSRQILPALLEEGRSFDLVWIDGDHAADMVTHDVGWALKLVKDGGILALHDLDEGTCPGVRQAVDAWRQPDYTIDTLAVYVEPNARKDVAA